MTIFSEDDFFLSLLSSFIEQLTHCQWQDEVCSLDIFFFLAIAITLLVSSLAAPQVVMTIFSEDDFLLSSFRLPDPQTVD